MADLIIKTGVRKYQGKAVDLGSWSPPVLRSKTKDGDTILERIPSAGHVKMVNPAGHVVPVQLFNGMGKPNAGDPYFLQVSREKLSKGFVPYGQCPKRLGLIDNLPEKVKEGSPCKIAADKESPIDNFHPCACVEATIDHRQTRSKREMAKLEAKYKSKEASQMDNFAKATDALVSMVQAAPKPAGKKAKADKNDG